MLREAFTQYLLSLFIFILLGFGSGKEDWYGPVTPSSRPRKHSYRLLIVLAAMPPNNLGGCFFVFNNECQRY